MQTFPTKPSIRRFLQGFIFVVTTLSTCPAGTSHRTDEHLTGQVKTVKTESFHVAPDRQEHLESLYEVTFNPEGYIVEEATHGPNGALKSRMTDEREGDRVLSTTKWNSRNEPVEITTYKYAPDGKVLEVTTMGEDGILQERVENTLGAEGSGELRTFGPDGTLKSIENYRRSDDGKTTKSATTENGKVISKEESRRDRNGNIEFRDYRALDDSKTIREFNKKGNHVVIISELQQDGTRMSTASVRNSKGLLIENSTETIYPKGKIHQDREIQSTKSRRKYDRNGNETELIDSHNNDKCAIRVKRRYVHDPQGNWIKREDWNEGCGMKPQLSFIQRRIITYY